MGANEFTKGRASGRQQGLALLTEAERVAAYNDKKGVLQLLAQVGPETFGTRIYALMVLERALARWEFGDADGAKQELSLLGLEVIEDHDDVMARVLLLRCNFARREAHSHWKAGQIDRSRSEVELAMDFATRAQRYAAASGVEIATHDAQQSLVYLRGLAAAIENAGPTTFDELLLEMLLLVARRDAATPRGKPLGLFGPTCLADLALRSSCAVPAMLGDVTLRNPVAESSFRQVFGSPIPGTYVDWLLSRTYEYMMDPNFRPLSAGRALVFLANRLNDGDTARAYRIQFALTSLALTHSWWVERRGPAGRGASPLPGVRKALARVSAITGMPSSRKMFR